MLVNGDMVWYFGTKEKMHGLYRVIDVAWGKVYIEPASSRGGWLQCKPEHVVSDEAVQACVQLYDTLPEGDPERIRISKDVYTATGINLGAIPDGVTV